MFPLSFSAVIRRTAVAAVVGVPLRVRVCVSAYLRLLGSEVGAELVRLLVGGGTSKQSTHLEESYSRGLFYGHTSSSGTFSSFS